MTIADSIIRIVLPEYFIIKLFIEALDEDLNEYSARAK